MKTQNVPPTYLLPFISFLENHGYEIKKANPRHVGGQGYSPPPYFANVDLQTAIDHFRDSQENTGFDVGTISDGYHTFNELYEHRIMLFIALCRLFNDLSIVNGEIKYVWRSKKHSDDSEWAGWFILGIGTVLGKQITCHLPDSKWALTEFAHTLDNAPIWDGHTSADVLERLQKHFL